jgi:hypothetical protein
MDQLLALDTGHRSIMHLAEDDEVPEGAGTQRGQVGSESDLHNNLINGDFIASSTTCLLAKEVRARLVWVTFQGSSQLRWLSSPTNSLDKPVIVGLKSGNLQQCDVPTPP